MRARGTVLASGASLAAVAAATATLQAVGVTAPTTVALTYLLVVLFVASWFPLAVATATSVIAMLSLNFFFMAPVGTFTIADPQNWVALVAFLAVAVVASHLSSVARARTGEAIERRNEVARLFDVSRDVLLTSDTHEAHVTVARHVSRRFDLPVVTMAVPAERGGWEVVHGGSRAFDVPPDELERAWASARGALEFDARTRSYGGHRSLESAAGPMALVPVRIGLRPVGLVALGGRVLDPGTADAIAGVIAIAVERARFLDERRAAELARQRADLSSALLASIGHDLRTPLTAIRIALSNVQDRSLPATVRDDQAELALAQVDHLSRLLQEILDMAQIETHAIPAERHWVTAADVVEAATAHVGAARETHRLQVEADSTTEVYIDPRLTSAALVHLLENAIRYSPAGSCVAVHGFVAEDGLRVSVSDEGSGLEDDQLERLFEPFVRGHAGRRGPAGTGLGLAITRGLLAVEGGRVWAEQIPGSGSRFSISVPAPRRAAAIEEP